MDYLKYHRDSARFMDIDPSNDCLKYISDRFELNMEQRYWLAFLYSTCYCAPTVYYMYNEFPDFEFVDVPRLQRWWNKNKSKLVFQTDRRRVKTQNLFVESFESYRKWVGNYSQQERFNQLKTPFPHHTWDVAEHEVRTLRNIGRFTSFIYLEMVEVLTDFKCYPRTIEWRYADNCRKGVCAAFGVADNQSNQWLDLHIAKLQKELKGSAHGLDNIFNIETTLCAYTKYLKGKRYVGYYLDRQRKEIDQMKANVTEGVHWGVLDQFRIETYKHLKE